MAVASLRLSLLTIRDIVCARMFGGQSGYNGLESGDQAECDKWILTGERVFWTNPPVDPENAGYVWKCLKDPGLLDLWGTVALGATTVTGVYSSATGLTTLTATAASFYETMIGKSIVITAEGTFTVAGYTSSTVITVTGDATCTTKTFSIASDGDYQLPADFDTPEVQKLRFTDASWIADCPLIDDGEVTTARANGDWTGYPTMASIRWKLCDGTEPHLQELLVWPRPEAGVSYQVALPFMAQPQGMSEANPYPRGGADTAQAMLEVILMVAEEDREHGPTGQTDIAKRVCNAAVRRDRTRHHNFIAGRMAPNAGESVRRVSVKDLILPA